MPHRHPRHPYKKRSLGARHPFGAAAPGLAPTRPGPRPPKPVAQVPEGPAGVIAIEVAAMVPVESRAPLARRHSPVRRSVEEADDMRVTFAVVGTVIVWLPPAAVATVIDVPVAAVTSPPTKAPAG